MLLRDRIVGRENGTVAAECVLRLLHNCLTIGQCSTVALQQTHIMTEFQRALPFGRRRHPLLTNCAVVSS